MRRRDWWQPLSDGEFTALIWGMMVALVIGCLLVLAPLLGPNRSPIRCTEDMACWDCTTMGNRVCGPTSEVGSLPAGTWECERIMGSNYCPGVY